MLPENILSGKVRDEYRRNADYRALFPFIKVTMERISFTMRDPIIRKIRMLLAAELTAPAVLQIARSDRQPQCEKECMEYIEKHLRHFCKVYMRED